MPTPKSAPLLSLVLRNPRAELTPTDRLIWFSIIDEVQRRPHPSRPGASEELARGWASAEVGMSDISYRTGLSRRTVQRTIARLEKLGVIVRVLTGDGVSDSVYRLGRFESDGTVRLFEKGGATETPPKLQGRQADAPPVDRTTPPGGDRATPHPKEPVFKEKQRERAPRASSLRFRFWGKKKSPNPHSRPENQPNPESLKPWTPTWSTSQRTKPPSGPHGGTGWRSWLTEPERRLPGAIQLALERMAA